MSFNALRVSLRRAAFSPVPRAPVRTAFRKYSTPPAPETKKSNTLLFAGLGGVAVLGLGYFVYSSSSAPAREVSTAAKSAAQAVKVAANFVPKKEDYQKVAAILRNSAVFDEGC